MYSPTPAMCSMALLVADVNALIVTVGVRTYYVSKESLIGDGKVEPIELVLV